MSAVAVIVGAAVLTLVVLAILGFAGAGRGTTSGLLLMALGPALVLTADAGWLAALGALAFLAGLHRTVANWNRRDDEA